MDAEAEELMRAHYAALPSEGRRSGKCAMSIPAGLYGARVLDVCCRAGKGAYELSDHVGAEGFVLGIDPNPSRIERAISHASDNHWAGSAWPAYLRFQCAYPEDLAQAGARDSSFDLIYVNCELNVVWNLPLALSEFARVLKSGGRLWVAQGVFASTGFGLARIAPPGNRRPPMMLKRREAYLPKRGRGPHSRSFAWRRDFAPVRSVQGSRWLLMGAT